MIQCTMKKKMMNLMIEEIAIMAQSEQPKADSSSSDSDKPLNYVPLLDKVIEKLCTVECLEQVEYYITYAFITCDKLAKEEKKHNKLKEDHLQNCGKTNDESISNTLPENINTNDHSPENEPRLNEFLKRKSDSESSNDKGEVEVFVETDKAKIQNGHPVKIKSYQPKNRMKQVYIAKGPQVVQEVSSSKHISRSLVDQQVMIRQTMDSIILTSSNGKKKCKGNRKKLQFKAQVI
ncbi:hypothetical protein QVD17_28683 [Tagetes erecta]|uniref:Uncharacterized protein n=1 Tax=Tagetes erecta TaxID=13708 RepID=A0AAD8KDU0_TARER|nr:hypothetical protein QVD17_28683 [Tagetes erecta]